MRCCLAARGDRARKSCADSHRSGRRDAVGPLTRPQNHQLGSFSRTEPAAARAQQHAHSDTPTPRTREAIMGSASSSCRVIYLDVDGRIQKVRRPGGGKTLERV